MLRVINDSALGSKPEIVPTLKPHIDLDFPAPTKRLFPKEGKTKYPDFNESTKAYAELGENPSPKNNYSNNNPSSTTKLTYREPNPARLY